MLGTAIECQVDDGFASVIEQLKGSLAVSTYQAGKVALIGWNGHGVSVFMREFDKPMGLAIRTPCMAIGLRHEIMLLANAPQLAPSFPSEQPGQYDSLFIPRVSLHTGDIAVHELAFDSKGELWICNTLFSCLSAPSSLNSFEPKWKPTFITEIAPEDRCHLNGIAMLDGKPGFVTCLAATDSARGWRNHKSNGGCVVDVVNNNVVLDKLCLPHSPRWHDGRLWLLNSGAGEILSCDTSTGAKDVVAVLPGYLRGMALVGNHAFVGMSMLRNESDFVGLPLHARHSELYCGICAIDVSSGRVVGSIRFVAGCTEVFDVQFVPGFRKMMVLNSENDESRQAYTTKKVSFWVRPKDGIRE